MDIIIALVPSVLLIGGLLALTIWAFGKSRKKDINKIVLERGKCFAGDNLPGARIKLVYIKGLILMYQSFFFSEILCEHHAKIAYKDYQKKLLMFGWWSLYGVFRTPALFLTNYDELMKFQKAIASKF